jgi:hypothetical protein
LAPSRVGVATSEVISLSNPNLRRLPCEMASQSALLLFDVACQIAHEVLVRISASAVQQVRECSFQFPRKTG